MNLNLEHEKLLVLSKTISPTQKVEHSHTIQKLQSVECLFKEELGWSKSCLKF